MFQFLKICPRNHHVRPLNAVHDLPLLSIHVSLLNKKAFVEFTRRNCCSPCELVLPVATYFVSTVSDSIN